MEALDSKPLFPEQEKESVPPPRKRNEYPPDFEKWWSLYRKGNKQTAFKRWKQHKIGLDEIYEPTRQYIAYCKETDRIMLDGEGFINRRTFETEWTHEAQQTKPRFDAPDKEKRTGPLFNI